MKSSALAVFAALAGPARHGCQPIALVLAIICTIAPSPADARGTVRVQERDGSVRFYHDATMRVVDRTLRITSADKQGTLVISDAACTLIGHVLRCLPYHVALEQNGTHQLDFEHGTLFYNPTDAKQHLTHSSTTLQAKGILGVLMSNVGTFVTLSGTLDGPAK